MCVSDNSLEALMASRLVPLDKRPGLRPTGVGEVLRRIAGKIVISVTKKDVVKASSKSQICGREAGSEAAIYAMKELFWKGAIRSRSSWRRSQRLQQCYQTGAPSQHFYHVSSNRNIRQELLSNLSACLFVIGGEEILSKEGTTQGDPLGMAIYAMAISLLLDILIATTQTRTTKCQYLLMTSVHREDSFHFEVGGQIFCNVVQNTDTTLNHQSHGLL